MASIPCSPLAPEISSSPTSNKVIGVCSVSSDGVDCSTSPSTNSVCAGSGNGSSPRAGMKGKKISKPNQWMVNGTRMDVTDMSIKAMSTVMANKLSDGWKLTGHICAKCNQVPLLKPPSSPTSHELVVQKDHAAFIEKCLNCDPMLNVPINSFFQSPLSAAAEFNTSNQFLQNQMSSCLAKGRGLDEIADPGNLGTALGWLNQVTPNFGQMTCMSPTGGIAPLCKISNRFFEATNRGIDADQAALAIEQTSKELKKKEADFLNSEDKDGIMKKAKDVFGPDEEDDDYLNLTSDVTISKEEEGEDGDELLFKTNKTTPLAEILANLAVSQAAANLNCRFRTFPHLTHAARGHSAPLGFWEGGYDPEAAGALVSKAEVFLLDKLKKLLESAPDSPGPIVAEINEVLEGLLKVSQIGMSQ